MNYDYGRLRNDLRNYFMSAYYGGGFDGAAGEYIAVEIASDDELLVIASRYGYDLESYIIKEKESFQRR